MKTALEIVKELHKLAYERHNEFDGYHSLCCTLEDLEKGALGLISNKQKITREEIMRLTQWVNRHQSDSFIRYLYDLIEKIKKIQDLSEEEFE